MKTNLSIEAAASACPGQDALIIGDRHYTYKQLATLAKHTPLPSDGLHRASPTLETALVLYASLQSRTPLALVSESLPAGELGDIRQRLKGAKLDDTVLILFTSGSSGASKGVRHSHEALIASAVSAGEALGWADHDRWLCCLPLSHIGGLSILIRCLVARKTVVLCDGFAPETVIAALTSHHVTHLSLVPTMLWRLLEHGMHAPPKLRITLMGGAALDANLVAQASAKGYRIRASYGMTETASMIVCDGHPLPGVQLRILDDERLLVRGPMLMQGYLSSDEEQPISDGWLQTTDRAQYDENGLLEILGRIDDVIISGGENISLQEVESRLCSHPRVEACLALGLPDPEWGHKLVALIVCRGEVESIAVDGLSGHKKPKLLISVDAIPLLENGKPDLQTARLLVLAQEI